MISARCHPNRADTLLYVNVLKDALGKRLGKMTGGVPTPLSGPETSATVMASDFLLEELDRIAQEGNDITILCRMRCLRQVKTNE